MEAVHTEEMINKLRTINFVFILGDGGLNGSAQRSFFGVWSCPRPACDGNAWAALAACSSLSNLKVKFFNAVGGVFGAALTAPVETFKTSAKPMTSLPKSTSMLFPPAGHSLRLSSVGGRFANGKISAA